LSFTLLFLEFKNRYHFACHKGNNSYEIFHKKYNLRMKSGMCKSCIVNGWNDSQSDITTCQSDITNSQSDITTKHDNRIILLTIQIIIPITTQEDKKVKQYLLWNSKVELLGRYWKYAAVLLKSHKILHIKRRQHTSHKEWI
jgi:hypothetical protein